MSGTTRIGIDNGLLREVEIRAIKQGVAPKQLLNEILKDALGEPVREVVERPWPWVERERLEAAKPATPERAAEILADVKAKLAGG